MNPAREGNAIVYCAGAFGTTNGKTAHGLVRRSERYHIIAVIDPSCCGEDAGVIMGHPRAGIPVTEDLSSAMLIGEQSHHPATHFIIGLAPDGGRLPPEAHRDVAMALEQGLHVVSGLHDFLGDDPDLAAIAAATGATIFDVRRPPKPNELHFFSGVIDRVESTRIAVLGTDSAVGKRTTAWLIVDEIRKRNQLCELIGTGQTAWLQGARHSIVMDSIINDFVAGEIENAIWNGWNATRPDFMVIEGQGSLLNPAYPGGFEILAASRPDCVVLQHAPGRLEYDGFPGFPLHPLERQMQAIDVISGCPIVAIAINPEGLDAEQCDAACEKISKQTGLVTVNPLTDGCEGIVDAILGRARPVM